MCVCVCARVGVYVCVCAQCVCLKCVETAAHWNLTLTSIKLETLPLSYAVKVVLHHSVLSCSSVGTVSLDPLTPPYPYEQHYQYSFELRSVGTVLFVFLHNRASQWILRSDFDHCYL